MAQKYGYRWENQVLNRTDDKIVAKSTVKNRKIPFLTVNLAFLYGYTMQILILNRIGASCRISNRRADMGKGINRSISHPHEK